MENLAEMSALVTEFAAGSALAIVPAVPEHDCGPEVCLGPDDLDLPGFLALADKLGAAALYLRAVQFSPDSDDDRPDNPPARLLQHAGETSQVSVAFAASGIIHFWEHLAAWYLEWLELADSEPSGRGTDEPGRVSGEERARLARELATTLLDSAQFRAAKAGARQRVARLAAPVDTDQGVSWDAVRAACDQAEELARAQYALITGRLDDLAAELQATSGYQQASSPGARKQAAEQFLIAHADGFSPPAHVRDELYARARLLAKTAKAGNGSAGLF